MFGRSRTWSSFCGVGGETFESALTVALDELGADYRREDAPGSFMLGGEASAVYTLAATDGATAQIRVYRASGDPLLRFFSSFRVAGESSLGGVCVVRVALDEGLTTEPLVSRALSRTVDRLPREPSEVRHHPRFRFAPLAAWRIRRRWRRWTDSDERP